MIVTVFRLRMNPDPTALEEYSTLAPHIGGLAAKMPGFVSAKRFIADDGERVTLVEFADKASHDAWARHPEHVAAKKLGRQCFFSEYSIQVCEVIKTMSKKTE